eukprot:COSAG05_NODE_719_length_7779_cov_30.552214_1_plen_213_part_10
MEGKYETVLPKLEALLGNCEYDVVHLDPYAFDAVRCNNNPGALETIGGGHELNASVELPSYIAPVAAVNDTHLPVVTVDSLFIDACFAVPSVTLPPPTSWQIPYQAMTIYTRNLTNTNNFTITMPGIPPSVSAIVMALRSTKHGMHSNRELYEKGALITKAITDGYTGTADEVFTHPHHPIQPCQIIGRQTGLTMGRKQNQHKVSKCQNIDKE